MRVLVVDGANVVGSVPDGWWRDRAGAAARLHDELTGQTRRYDMVVLVLEGRARDGVPPGEHNGIRTVHAPHEGDDEIVAQCEAYAVDGHEVTLASADRRLAARVTPLGVSVVGPSSVRR